MNDQHIVFGHSRHIVGQFLRDIHRAHTGSGFGQVPEPGRFIGWVFDRLIDGDGTLLQVNIIPRQSGQFSPAKPGQHHNNRYRLPTVRGIPYPFLLLGTQGPALFRLLSRFRKLY